MRKRGLVSLTATRCQWVAVKHEPRSSPRTGGGSLVARQPTEPMLRVRERVKTRKKKKEKTGMEDKGERLSFKFSVTLAESDFQFVILVMFQTSF